MLPPRTAMSMWRWFLRTMVMAANCTPGDSAESGADNSGTEYHIGFADESSRRHDATAIDCGGSRCSRSHSARDSGKYLMMIALSFSS